ncbi:hypothetical protein HYT18_04395 [Candidatus Microgenomates bacterium]|nr:hypothetical protein [Candidatus Microgenomates bacterium]
MWKRSKGRIKRRNGKFISGSLSKLILILLIILILTSAYLFINSNLFTIKNIDIEAHDISCVDNSDLKHSSKLLGQNLIFTNYSTIKKEFTDKFICIKSVESARFFPDRVRLQVFGRKPVASLTPLKFEEATSSSVLEKFSSPVASESAYKVEETASDTYLVDIEGVIFAKNSDQADIPKLIIDEQNLSLGLKVAQDIIKNSILIFDKLNTFGVEVEDAKIYSKEFLLVNGEPRIIFRLVNNLDIQLASLQLILNKAKIDKEKLEFIDLRFDKPIVRFAPKKNG